MVVSPSINLSASLLSALPPIDLIREFYREEAWALSIRKENHFPS